MALLWERRPRREYRRAWETYQATQRTALADGVLMFWCELDPHEQAEVLEELGLEGIWEVLWFGHNYAGHAAGCGPVYGLRGAERAFAYCLGCQLELPFIAPL